MKKLYAEFFMLSICLAILPILSSADPNWHPYPPYDSWLLGQYNYRRELYYRINGTGTAPGCEAWFEYKDHYAYNETDPTGWDSNTGQTHGTIHLYVSGSSFDSGWVPIPGHNGHAWPEGATECYWIANCSKHIEEYGRMKLTSNPGNWTVDIWAKELTWSGWYEYCVRNDEFFASEHFDEDWMYKVRRSILLGQDFIDRLYKETNGSQWGCMSEYPTTNPLGIYIHETGKKHSAGDGDMEGTPGNEPSVWYAYWELIDSNLWEFVEPQTREYLYICDSGFEEAERMDPIWGDQAFCNDNNEPHLIVEYEPNQLLWNPSVEFRKFNDPNVDLDDPWNWTKVTAIDGIARMGVLETGSPTNPIIDKGSHTGGYCLVLQPGSGYAKWYQTVAAKPDTQYYFSYYYYGKILGDDVLYISVIWYDANDNPLSYEIFECPSGDFTAVGWQRFNRTTSTSPSATAKAVFQFVIDSKSSNDLSWVYGDTFFFYKNGIPINAMRSAFQVFGYYGDRTVDLYLDGDCVVQNVNRDYNPIPRPYFTKTKQTFQSMRTAIRHECPNGKLYYKYTSDNYAWQDRTNKISTMQSYYDIVPSATPPSYDWYQPMYAVTSNYPTNWYWNNWYNKDYPGLYEYNSIYDYKYGDTDWLYNPYGKAPFRDINNHPYRSKVLLNPTLFMEGWDTGNFPFPKAGHWMHPISLSMMAMYYLEKTNDPNYHFNYWGKGDATPAGIILGPSYGPSPAGYILQYWTNCGILYPQALNPYNVYAATNQALCLAVLTELGYGYGYSIARTYADALAQIIINIQWGNPDATGKPQGWGKHETNGWINRPDCTGGYIIVYKGGSYVSTSDTYLIDMLADFHYGMPKETRGILPVNQESQFCVRALQIYDWYKFKKDGAVTSGIFPRLLIPEDIDGNGKVDLKDVYRVSKAYGSYPGHPDWDPLCDVNVDKKVDLKDYTMVNKNYGRTSD